MTASRAPSVSTRSLLVTTLSRSILNAEDFTIGTFNKCNKIQLYLLLLYDGQIKICLEVCGRLKSEGSTWTIPPFILSLYSRWADPTYMEENRSPFNVCIQTLISLHIASDGSFENLIKWLLKEFLFHRCISFSFSYGLFFPFISSGSGYIFYRL